MGRLHTRESLEYRVELVKLLTAEIRNRSTQFYYSYNPASDKHRDFHLCGKKIRILTGAPRTGKTTAAIQDLVMVALGEHPKYQVPTPNIGWVVVPKFHKIYETGGMLDKWAAVIPRNRVVSKTVDRKLNQYEYRLDNGSCMLFKSQEQGVDSFTSNEVHWILADERVDNHDIRIQMRARVISLNGLMVYTMDKLEDDEWVDELKTEPYVHLTQLELRDNAKYLPHEELERLEHELDEVDKERIFFGNYKDRDTINIFSGMFNDKNYVPMDGSRFEIINGEFIPSEAGDLRVFHEPKKDTEYVMAWDVCEGIRQNAHAVQIFDEHGEQCARWLNSTVDYNRLAADVLVPLGLYYHNALGVGELRSYGYAVMGHMMQYPYPNLYVDVQNKKIKQIGKQARLRFGVVTDEVNKPEMVQQLYGDLKAAKLLLHDEFTKMQLDHFVQKAGKVTQKRGAIKYGGTRIKGIPELKFSDDDLVLALMFADRALNGWDMLKPRIQPVVTTADQVKKKIYRVTQDAWDW